MGLVQTKLVNKYDRQYVARLPNTITVQSGNEILVRVKIPNNLRSYNLIACSAAGEEFKIWGVARSLVKADKKEMHWYVF